MNVFITRHDFIGSDRCRNCGSVYDTLEQDICFMRVHDREEPQESEKEFRPWDLSYEES